MHGRRRIARQHDGRNLAGIRRSLQPRHQLIRQQRRRRPWHDLHDAGIQMIDDLVFKAHDHAGQRNQGQQQREHEAGNGMDLEQRRLDRVPEPTHRSPPS
jgi:hypothetical protein